jgi:thiol-disulfide isomerase/thioredoxin
MRKALQRYRELRRTSRWLRWAEDLLLLAVLFGGVLAWQTRGLVPSGSAAPPFVLRDLDGRAWALSSLVGKPVVLHFWAPWCSVCKTESPNVSSLRRAVGGDVTVISVAVSYRDADDVRRFVREQGVDYPVLLGDEALMDAYRVSSLPTTYFLTKDGRIRHASVGYTSTLGMRVRLWL